MTESDLLKIISGGENLQVEFKKSTSDITKDVYDTVCAFSNRDGGTIILGVKDNGEILGLKAEAVENIKKDFVNTINNGQKINPPLYLQTQTFTINGRILLVIDVPCTSEVCRHRGRIFDRNNEEDLDKGACAHPIRKSGDKQAEVLQNNYCLFSLNYSNV